MDSAALTYTSLPMFFEAKEDRGPVYSPHGMHLFYTQGWVVTHTTHTHTHTHAIRWVGGIDLLLFPILASSPRDSQEQWAASDAAPGDQVQVLSPVLVRDRTVEHLLFFACFYCWGSMGGTRVNTGRTCKLHTERPGNKPRHVARCGTWTHDLLAVRQQCYALSHRAGCIGTTGHVNHQHTHSGRACRYHVLCRAISLASFTIKRTFTTTCVLGGHFIVVRELAALRNRHIAALSRLLDYTQDICANVQKEKYSSNSHLRTHLHNTPSQWNGSHSNEYLPPGCIVLNSELQLTRGFAGTLQRSSV